MRVVSLNLPTAGGLHGVVTNLRKGLQPLGVNLTWLAAGAAAAAALAGSTAAGETEWGRVIAESAEAEPERAQAYISQLVSSRAPVLIHVLGGIVETNLARYLPNAVAKLLLVHSITPATYRAARSIRHYVHATIAVSPRICADLVSKYGFNREWTFTVPNAIDDARFKDLNRRPLDGGPLRVLLHGRLEDDAKGVLWIPAIVEDAIDHGAQLRLTVSGDGPHLAAFQRAIERSGLSAITTYRGWTGSQDVPSLMAEHDVFLLPSRFEGMALGLLEAMAAGCVPLASAISGVTDYVIQDGDSGLLFPVGNAAAAARHLVVLSKDRSLFSRMSTRARRVAEERFRLDQQALAFHSILRKVVAAPPEIRPALALEHWRVPRGLRPAWWHGLPQPLKNRVREWRARSAWFPI